MSLENEDMATLIKIETMLEEIMSQINNGMVTGDDYSWHCARVGLMHTSIIIDKLYEDSNTCPPN